MSIRIVQDRLNQYQPKNQFEEENAIREITQEIALSGLARTGFFKVASFQGGTCLRVLYGLNRFSEDLDFSLIKPNLSFDWGPYLKALQTELKVYGYQIEVQDRSSVANPIKVGFLKDDSVGKILLLNHRNSGMQRSIKIKLEIDTNPPEGRTTMQKYIEFPVAVPVLSDDLPSLFSGKSHALLCRDWEKGRDWYDFVWYVSRKTQINLNFLSQALFQMGPWKNQEIKVTREWYLEKIRKKIENTNWASQKKDVQRFLKQDDVDLLHLWNKEFFLDRLEVLEKCI